jgi:hypothetical protein
LILGKPFDEEILKNSLKVILINPLSMVLRNELGNLWALRDISPLEHKIRIITPILKATRASQGKNICKLEGKGKL